MMRKKHVSGLWLVLLLCICLQPVALGQDKRIHQQTAADAALLKEKPKNIKTENLSRQGLIPLATEEPVWLLFAGLLVFVGATTLRRIRARHSI